MHSTELDFPLAILLAASKKPLLISFLHIYDPKTIVWKER